jgi:hypothetical protein
MILLKYFKKIIALAKEIPHYVLGERDRLFYNIFLIKHIHSIEYAFNKLKLSLEHKKTVIKNFSSVIGAPSFSNYFKLIRLEIGQ